MTRESPTHRRCTAAGRQPIAVHCCAARTWRQLGPLAAAARGGASHAGSGGGGGVAARELGERCLVEVIINARWAVRVVRRWRQLHSGSTVRCEVQVRCGRVVVNSWHKRHWPLRNSPWRSEPTMSGSSIRRPLRRFVFLSWKSGDVSGLGGRALQKKWLNSSRSAPSWRWLPLHRLRRRSAATPALRPLSVVLAASAGCCSPSCATGRSTLPQGASPRAGPSRAVYLQPEPQRHPHLQQAPVLCNPLRSPANEALVKLSRASGISCLNGLCRLGLSVCLSICGVAAAQANIVCYHVSAQMGSTACVLTPEVQELMWRAKCGLPQVNYSRDFCDDW